MDRFEDHVPVVVDERVPRGTVGLVAVNKTTGERVANCLEFGTPQRSLLDRAKRLQKQGWEYIGGQFYLRPVKTPRGLAEAERITRMAREIGRVESLGSGP